MAETNEVLPACPWPTSATFLTFSPVYTFTGSPPSEATNLTQLKLQAQLGKAGLWASDFRLQHGPSGSDTLVRPAPATNHVGTGALTRPVERQLDDKYGRVTRTPFPISCRFPNPRAMLGAQCSASPPGFHCLLLRSASFSRCWKRSPPSRHM